MSEVKQYATIEEYLKDLFADEEFAHRLFEMDEPEDVQAALLEKGLDISIEGVIKLRDMIDAMIEKGGELSVEELDEVAGGEVTLALTGAAAVGLAKNTSLVLLGAGGVGVAVVAVAAVGALLGYGIWQAVRRRW